MIELQKFTTFEEVASIRLEWDRFVEAQTADIFLTYDWCRIWWKYYGNKRELVIFILRCEGNICGILPMFMEHIRIGPIFMKVIKLMCVDYSPVTIPIAIKTEHLKTGFTLILKELLNNKAFDLIYFGALSGRYQDANTLVDIINNTLSKSFNVEIKELDVQNYFSVENSWEKQMEKMSSSHRRNTRRVYKEIRDKGMSLKTDFATTETWTSMFEGFVGMHQEHWRKLGKPGHFAQWPFAYDFHKEVAGTLVDLDRLRLAEIKLDNRTLGFEYMYKLGNSYCWFLPARAELEKESKIDFLRLSYGEKVKKAVTEGVTCIDAMRGRYQYKNMMGGKALPVYGVYVFPAKNVVLLKVKCFRWLVKFANILYSKIWLRRVAPRIGFIPGQHNDLWVRTHMLSR